MEKNAADGQRGSGTTGKSRRGADQLPAPEARERARSRPDQAATYIRRLIFERVLLPGTKIPQERIAVALGLSRIPIREALVALEKEGRVKLIHHRGAYVASVSEQSVRDMADLAVIVNGFTARRAAERATADFLARVEKIRDAIVNDDDPVSLYHHYDRLQDDIVEFGVGGRIAAFLRDLRVLGPDTLFAEIPSLIPAFKVMATELVDAIAQQDAAGAEAVIATWQKAFSEGVLTAYEAVGMFRPTHDADRT